MDIRILELVEGARRAEGLTVVIDVFRAFSLEAYLFAAGAEKILAVGREETARQLKSAHPGYLLVGERGGKKLPGFDYGNSPSQTRNAQLSGRTVIHTTSAGTQGLVNAVHADRILTGSLVNAGAIADYIRQLQPDIVSLVAMGVAGKTRAPEDMLCARYIRSLLTGEPLDLAAEKAALLREPEAVKFFNPDTQEIYPREDCAMCTDFDRFDFVLRAEPAGEDIFRISRI